MRYLLLFSIFCCMACTQRTQSFLYDVETAPSEAQLRPVEFTTKLDAYTCRKWFHYLPTEDGQDGLPVKQIRMNFHIMRDNAGTQNFSPKEARTYIKNLLSQSNKKLRENEVNWQSPDGTPALPMRYEYVLTGQPGDDGIYEHFDDAHCYYVVMGKNQNNYNRKVSQKYQIGGDSIMNVFIQIHHPDSIASKHYRAKRQAIALGNFIKLSGLWELGNKPWKIRGMFNHEVGHNLGLSHAWGHDGCDDTNTHPNKCWSRKEEGFCKDNATNNMMDYNSQQIALTPCQIGKIHANFANQSYRSRKALVQNWCTIQEGGNVVIRDSIEWNGARDLEGNLRIQAGAYLRLSCRLSMPENATITIAPGATLHLTPKARIHNDCGRRWSGIFYEKNKKTVGKILREEGAIIEDVVEGGSNATEN